MGEPIAFSRQARQVPFDPPEIPRTLCQSILSASRLSARPERHDLDFEDMFVDGVHSLPVEWRPIDPRRNGL